MATTLKPYANYRESGLEWLGEIPAEWRVRRLRYVLDEIDDRSETGTETLLSVSQYTGVTPRQKRVDGTVKSRSASLVGYKKADTNDLVVNIMLAWNGSLGTAPHAGIVSPAYGVYRLRVDAHPRYIHYLLRTPLYRSRIRASSTGVVESRLRLYSDDLYNLEAILPPLDTQRRIARFLDDSERRVNRLIRAKQRLVALLNEQKRAIIQRAVTRGLDPDVPLKPSGVDWIGEMPAHWDVARIKGHFKNLNRLRIPLSTVERGRMRSRKYDYYGASGVIDRVDDYLFDDDLILIAEDGANLVLRNLPLAIIARGRFWVNNHAHILKPQQGNTQFWAYLLETLDYRPWITGAAQPKLTQDRVMAIPIPVPSVGEQDEIVAYVRDNTKQLDEVIQRSRSEIDLVREYHTRLIADVVTGRLDVRNVVVEVEDDGADAELDVGADDDPTVDDDEEALAYASK